MNAHNHKAILQNIDAQNDHLRAMKIIGLIMEIRALKNSDNIPQSLQCKSLEQLIDDAHACLDELGWGE